MSLLDGLLPASFAGIAFPVQEIDVKGSLRHHVHEYLKAPGGDVEELARRLYQITMRAAFHDTFAKWPRLYESLGKLMALFETGGTYPLHIPTIGTIGAKCINWDRRLVARVKSGETAEFVFLEHQDTAFLVDKLLVPSADSLRGKLQDFLIVIEEEELDTSLFDALKDAANSVLAVADQAEMMSNLVEAKLSGFTDLCAEVDARVQQLNEPEHHRVLEAFHELWSAAAALTRDVLKLGRPLDTFIVPAPMAITQACAAIYGNTARAVELLKLNDLDDALAIRPGTKIRHYAKAA